ncbi:hypothetical protein FPOAC2_07119 [Fusarium poae]|jgi:hypothetical protein|uniref:hypothetical protein n=1 Tax=Fusarium poae TaxID=36050 RepID=UPI001CEA19E5|nr:hypothetical protein FPOAC1_006977 [Fusarium poae]KAG8673663.1 hypothetical protein FPOAC1_006977 [Fusarium poae]
MPVQREIRDSLRYSTAALQPGHIALATGSRRTESWDREFADTDWQRLEELQCIVGSKLHNARKAVKRETGDDCWERYLQISRLNIQKVQLDSQINLIKFDDEKWYEQPIAQELKLQHDIWTQWEKTVSKQKSRCTRETFLRLSPTSGVGGFDMPRGQGQRNNSAQSNMCTAMWNVYCPDAKSTKMRWDPIRHKWGDSENTNAAHLFPWSQSAFMDEIFGNGAAKELFSPRNGIFLHKFVEQALDKGLIVIVPDIDLNPTEPDLPLNDETIRQKRSKEWEEMTPKEYKVMVVDKNHPEVTKELYEFGPMGFSRLLDLHERKLKFRTDFRPRSRYIWWTFLNAILRTAWTGKQEDKNIQHEEVRKSTRYWGRKYVKRNQLLGFVEEIGHDVESILTIGPETEEEQYDQEPRYEVTRALVEAAGVKSVQRMKELRGEDSDDYDSSDSSDDSDNE